MGNLKSQQVLPEELRRKVGSPLRAVESLALRGRWVTTIPEVLSRTDVVCTGLAASVGKSIAEASQLNVLS